MLAVTRTIQNNRIPEEGIVQLFGVSWGGVKAQDLLFKR